MKNAVVLILITIVVWMGVRIADLERQNYAMITGLCAPETPSSLPSTECLMSVKSRESFLWDLFYGLLG